MRSTASQALDYGKAVLARLDGMTISKALAGHVAAFRGEHDRFEAAAGGVDKAREARDRALETVGKDDDTLDASLLFLADRLVGAGLGARKNPFSGYSKHSPTAMSDLPYATEAAAVHDLVKAIGRKKPLPSDVQKALGQCEANATRVEKSLKDLIGPQAALAKALGARDTGLPGWQKALKRLKMHAAAEWSDEESTYKAVFAAPDRVQAPVKKRKKAGGDKPAGQPLLVAAAGGEAEVGKVEVAKPEGAKPEMGKKGTK